MLCQQSYLRHALQFLRLTSCDLVAIQTSPGRLKHYLGSRNKFEDFSLRAVVYAVEITRAIRD
jgi:hypothetical protein